MVDANPITGSVRAPEWIPVLMPAPSATKPTAAPDHRDAEIAQLRADLARLRQAIRTPFPTTLTREEARQRLTHLNILSTG